MFPRLVFPSSSVTLDLNLVFSVGIEKVSKSSFVFDLNSSNNTEIILQLHKVGHRIWSYAVESYEKMHFYEQFGLQIVCKLEFF